MAILVDTGPLYALADASDRHHLGVRRYLEATREVLVVPISVLPELCYLVGKFLGVEAEAQVVMSVALGEGGLRIETLGKEDLARAAGIMSQYADSKVGFVDASLVAVAERLGISTVLTLDRRHFGVFRPRHCDAFDLIPL